MLYQGHKFLDGIKRFWLCVSVWKTNLVVEDHAVKTDENVTKAKDLVRSDRRLTVRMISSVLNLNRQTVHDSDKGFIVSGQRLRTLGCCIMTTLPVTLPSP